jgi:ABC-type phosphate/phosphonate transport system substrate-binding protein
MSAYSAQDLETRLNKREEEASRGLVVSDPAAVIEAASAGHVEMLILSPTAPGFTQREEAINWAALATIRHGGKFAISSGSQPESGISAILRFHAAEESQSEDIGSAREMRLPAALHLM